MPLYEYQCDACGHRFEEIQKFSDPPAEVCPKCGARNVQKLMSSPAIKFKGSGFYINDYAPKGAAGTDTKETAPKTGTATDTPSKASSSSDSSTTTSSSDSAAKTSATPSTKDT